MSMSQQHVHTLTEESSESFLHCLVHFVCALADYDHIIVCVRRREAALVGLALCRLLCQASCHTAEVHPAGKYERVAVSYN